MLQARLLLLAAAALWSTAGAAMKLCGLNGLQIAGGRSLVAGIFLLVAMPDARRWPTRRGLLPTIAYVATVTLFAVANKLTTAANAIFIQDTAPLWVVILSPWLLREKPSRGELFALPVFGVGLALFFLDQLSPGQLLGNVVAAAAGVSFAFLIMGSRRAGSDGAAALAHGNLLAALITLPFFGLGPSPHATDLGILLFLGVIQLGLPYLCFARGVQRVPALEASLLVLLEPILNPVWTFLFAGEKPGPWALAGGAVVLGATAWRTLAPLVARGVAARVA